jgi:hypothetical protein
LFNTNQRFNPEIIVMLYKADFWQFLAVLPRFGNALIGTWIAEDGQG